MPKRRRAKSKSKARATQSQRQTQRVTVNIGKTTVTKRKQSGKGGLPPPSHMHNLAPTFVTAPQVDFVGLIGEISRLTKQVQDPVPIRNPVTPLQSTLIASNAEKMAGEAAIRRAGPTAERFQPVPSMADERLAQQIQDQDDVTARQELAQKVFPVAPMPTKGDGEPAPAAFAEGIPKRGRPFVDMSEISLGESLIKSAPAQPVVQQAQAQALVNTNRAEEPDAFEGSKIKGIGRLKKEELQTIARERNIDPSGLTVTQLRNRLTGKAEKEPRPKKKIVEYMGL